MLIAMYVGNKPNHFGDVLELNKEMTQFALRGNEQQVYAKEDIMKNKDFVLFFQKRESYIQAKEPVATLVG